MKGDWKPISRAFTDHLSEFAAVDPDRLAVSYQVPIIDIDYAVSEVVRLADLGAQVGPSAELSLGARAAGLSRARL